MSEDDNPTHSMSSVDLDVDETGEEGGGSGHESPETVVRAKFAFTGEGEDEVKYSTCKCINTNKIFSCIKISWGSIFLGFF